ncbi:amidohydrolase family protein [Spirosoma validum]|uniref:amidohydrolase family protein n=1 Tax=Spirosoma validum TaxID=2771355 RepID=UPI00293B89EF|nr:amidohydrolase family protein [Spirosoma validum]
MGIVHPRTLGNFARLLGKYVRDEHVMPLEEAVRWLTSLPAINHKLPKRSLLRLGYFADVVIIDPATIADKAPFADPFQYSVGVQYVLTNGKHTNVFPERSVDGHVHVIIGLKTQL